MKIVAINTFFKNSPKNNNLYSDSNTKTINNTFSSTNFKGVLNNADKFVPSGYSKILQESINAYNSKLKRVFIPLTEEGKEQGLNCIIGLNRLKAGLYNDLLMPLCETMDGQNKHYKIPNGIHFFGPMDTGKTFLTQKLGEHYILKGGYYEDLMNKLPWNIEQDNQPLEKAFSDAEKRFIDSGKRKYTMFSLDAIDSYLGKNKDTDVPCKNKLIELTKNCKDRGVILLSTSDYLEKTEPVLLLNGRTDLRIPLDYVSDEDIPEFINYYIKRHNLPNEGQIDYLEISDLVKEKELKYTPKGIEKRIIEPFYDYVDYGGKVNTSAIIEAITQKRDFSSEAEQLKKLKREKTFANKLGGIYEY